MSILCSADLDAVRDELADRADADELLRAVDDERRGLADAELPGKVHVLLDQDLAERDARLVQELFGLLAGLVQLYSMGIADRNVYFPGPYAHHMGSVGSSVQASERLTSEYCLRIKSFGLFRPSWDG